jgi:hypothetical protein
MTARPPFRFSNPDATAVDAEITLGDMNLAPHTYKVEFVAAVGEVPTVRLTMPLIGGATLDVEGAIVELAPETCAALVALGWTPPPMPAAPIPGTDSDDDFFVEDEPLADVLAAWGANASGAHLTAPPEATP